MFRTELDYDWTYQTKYSGELEGLRSEATDLAIPYDRLKPGNGREVLFFDENILYEDEMGDNGTTVFSVKTVPLIIFNSCYDLIFRELCNSESSC